MIGAQVRPMKIDSQAVGYMLGIEYFLLGNAIRKILFRETIIVDSAVLRDWLPFNGAACYTKRNEIRRHI